MNYPPLEELKYELIKAHFLDPDNSPLPSSYQNELTRIVSVTKLLDRYPNKRDACSMHLQKYPEISQATAYRDIDLSIRLFKTFHTFDFEFWHTWLLNDIVKNINNCALTHSDKDRRIIAMEHANLVKLIGNKPEELTDPKRTEKHQFYIMLQGNSQFVKMDPYELKDLPVATIHEIQKAMYSGPEITDAEAEEILKS